MERTSRGKHESGDTAWEEQNMRVYKKSVVRFMDILEETCQDIDRSQDQCLEFMGEVDELVEQWFLDEQETQPDLHLWLCVNERKVCCPPNTYGPDCLQCSDCSGNGFCKGNNTRKGNGKCSCYTGYTGENCNQCDLQYYESFRDDTKLLCTECHAACAKNTGCKGPGPKGIFNASSSIHSCQIFECFVKKKWHLMKLLHCFNKENFILLHMQNFDRMV